ncbi:DUF6509 family protein [Metabacillus herbersteinensis]|uniref:DUF6509 family protein n=1 Tax=Metabacillus herbersteinensis TaxID=283816 RepID=A0ABV6GB25_9BACI
MNITSATFGKINDPFGILAGERYEFFLNIDVPEDDELYTENGLLLKVIYVKEEDQSRIAQYNFVEEANEKTLDFELDEEEMVIVDAYCKEKLAESKG